MTRKTFTVTPTGDPEWRGLEGPDPFKSKGHYCMLVLFILGVVGIIAIGIWIGIDAGKKNAAKPDTQSKPPYKATVTTTGYSPSTTPEPRSTTIRTSRSTTTVVDVLSELQGAMSGPNRVKRSQFTNWDMTTTVSDVYIASPRDHTEIQKLVLAAKRTGLRIRATGGGLSYSNLFVDEGHIMLDLSQLTFRPDGKKLAVNGSFEKFSFSTVSVPAGLSLLDLRQQLVENELQINSLPVAFDSTVGGVISTASHGTGPDDATASDYVVGVQYVDSEGELQSASISQPEHLNRIRCCLGLCGIIYGITFRVEPMRMSKVVQGFKPASATIKNSTFMAEVFSKSGYEMFLAPLSSFSGENWKSYQSTGKVPESYDPWQDEFWYRIYEDVPVTSSNAGRRKKRSAEDSPPEPALLGTIIDPVPTNTTTPTPTLHTALMAHKWAYEMTVGIASSAPSVALPHPQVITHINSSDLSKTYSFSLFVPQTADQSGDVAVRVFEVMFAVNSKYLARGEQPYLTVELRWIRPSKSCVLCPGSFPDADRVLNIDVISAPWKPKFFTFASELTTALRKEWPDIRMHWAKFYENVSGVKDLIKTSMADALKSMADTTQKVAFRDLFTTDLLSGLAN